MIAAASAVAAAVREMQTRQIGQAVPVLVVAFWGAVAITLCGAVFIVTEDWRLFAGADLFQLFVAAFFVGIAIYLLALGFRDVDLSVVAPFRYTLSAHLRARRLPGVPGGARRLDRGGRGPDRGQRHLHAASRSGAPPLADRHGSAGGLSQAAIWPENRVA